MLPLPPVWVAIALTIAPVATPAPARVAPPVRADTVMANAAMALERGRPW